MHNKFGKITEGPFYMMNVEYLTMLCASVSVTLPSLCLQAREPKTLPIKFEDSSWLLTFQWKQL